MRTGRIGIMLSGTLHHLLRLIGPLYDEISALELELSLRATRTDLRPRIDVFHDAVQALSSGRGYQLTVPQLADNLRSLRTIAENPRHALDDTPSFSAQTLPVVVPPGGGRRYDPRFGRLSELYRNYTVLYAGLFGESAETQYRGEKEAYDAHVAFLAGLAAQVKSGELSTEALAGVLRNADEPELAEEARTAGRDGAGKALRKGMQRTDAAKEQLDKHYVRFLSSQMVVFQDAKELVQKLAMAGINVAGSYVQSSADRHGPPGSRPRGR